jgi:hypothetical protein
MGEGVREMNFSKQVWFFVSRKQLNGLVSLQHTYSRQCLAVAIEKQIASPERAIEHFYKKLDKQGAMIAHWKVAELMFELEKELGLKGKSSCEIMHEYGQAQTKKFLRLAKGDKKKAFKMWLLDEFRPEKARKEGVAYFGGFKAKTKHKPVWGKKK